MTTDRPMGIEETQAEECDAAGYTKSMRELLDSLGGYQNVFNAIADATSVYAEGVGVSIGVRAFIRSITPHRQSSIASLTDGVGTREALKRERDDMIAKLGRDEITIHDFAQWAGGIVDRLLSAPASKADPFGGPDHPGDIASLTYAPDAVREALPRLDCGLIEAAMHAHYGADAGSIDGLDLTVRDHNWTFREGFKRMWGGVRAELKRRNATTPPAKDDAGRLREALEKIATVARSPVTMQNIARAALSPQSDEGEERHG